MNTQQTSWSLLRMIYKTSLALRKSTNLMLRILPDVVQGGSWASWQVAVVGTFADVGRPKGEPLFDADM